MSTPDFTITKSTSSCSGKVTVNTQTAAEFIKYNWGDAAPVESILGSEFDALNRYIDELKEDAARLVFDDQR